MKKNIQSIVATELCSATRDYLTEIVDHGIHNLTNSFQGQNNGEYAEFAREFREQAQALLAADQ